MRIQTFSVIAGAALIIASPVSARTWYVERDGSGDFILIQDAVDAASPGDVIQLGPGRFDEWYLPPNYPNNPTFVNVTKDLTFVGSGMGETLIGPESVLDFPWNSSASGFMVFPQSPCQQLILSDLTVENIMRNGVYLAHGRIEMDRCEIRGCVWAGVDAQASLGGWVRDCSFHDNGYWGEFHCEALYFYQPSIGVLVENCDFESNFGVGIGVYWSGCVGIDIRNCRINRGANGIVFASGASGSIRNCNISDQYLRGIYLSRSGSIVLEDNDIEVIQDSPIQVGVVVGTSAENLIMRNNVVISNGYVLWFDARVRAGDISQNHFLRASETAWWVSTGDYYPLTEPRIINLENNYWGTTDTALIDQWIYDGNDNENVDVFIDYLPLADGPVQTESTTWGAVKTLFR